MNRTELVEVVAETAGLDKRHAEAAVMAFVDSVMSEVRTGNKVSIFGFGTFTPTSRAARVGRNPQTGAPVKIAASKGVRFAPASAFKSSLNTKKTAAKKTAAKKATAAKAPAKATTAKRATATKSTAKKTTAVTKAATAKRAPAAKKR